MKSFTKILKIMFFIFVPISLIILIIGSCLTISYYKKINSEDYIKTTAIISDIECHTQTTSDGKETVCNAFVNYEANNEKYNDIQLSYYSSNMSINDKIEIYYNKNNPYNLLTKEIFIVGIILICCGLFFLLISYFTMYLPVKMREKRINYLLTNGKQVYVKVIKIKENRTISINGEHPYYAVCVYTDEYGYDHFLDSESTMKELGYWFESKGDTDVLLKAYIDKNNNEKYYIPVENLF